jgi:hypothetical protein
MPELTLDDFGKRLLMVKDTGAGVHPLLLSLLITLAFYAFLLAIGAYIGAAVNRPLLGLLLTAFLGPFGWIVLFIVAMKDGKRVQERPGETNKQRGDF